jgi:hypothetical protein
MELKLLSTVLERPPVLKPKEETMEITIKEEVIQLKNKVGFRKFSKKPITNPLLFWEFAVPSPSCENFSRSSLVFEIR